MVDRSLLGCRILVVEDEYVLADELRTELTEAGGIVLGPVATVEDSLDLIRAEPHIDGAILDVNLRGESAYPAADLLAERNVPFVFATGYDASAIPSRFTEIVRCEKPVSIRKIAQALGRIVGSDKP